MKYIFVAGAPGSKWSSVVKNIYNSRHIDRSDHKDHQVYYHPATGMSSPMHIGAYFDPGMEYGRWFDKLNEYSRDDCEQEFDRAFGQQIQGIRIIKSHVFCNHIDFLRQTWPECPVIFVRRSDDSCLGHWVRCGGFDISYPDYREYYQNIATMYAHIQEQNRNLIKSLNKYVCKTVYSNFDLAERLGLSLPQSQQPHDYIEQDIDVKVLLQ